MAQKADPASGLGGLRRRPRQQGSPGAGHPPLRWVLGKCAGDVRGADLVLPLLRGLGCCRVKARGWLFPPALSNPQCDPQLRVLGGPVNDRYLLLRGEV